MHSRALSIYDQMVHVISGISFWFWDTTELLLDIILEFIVRSMDLAVVIFNLVFQVICFLRDLCIDAMQTFANVFRGIVNVVGSIDTEDVEDFASACLVVVLWIGAARFLLHTFNKNYGRYHLPKMFFRRRDKFEPIPAIHDHTWIKRPTRRRSNGPRKKRNAT